MPILDFIIANKGITPDQARQQFHEVTAVAATEGLGYDLAAAQHTSTFDAHRLVHLAADQGRAGAMIERLLSGYLERGESVDDSTTLMAMAAQAGLDIRDVDAVLRSDRYAGQVHADQADAASRGITVGPYLLFDGAQGISGHGDHTGADPTVIPTALHTATAHADTADASPDRTERSLR